MMPGFLLVFVARAGREDTAHFFHLHLLPGRAIIRVSM
jgi:hypothetical protein